jgi:SAM-dependent methyltransferase
MSDEEQSQASWSDYYKAVSGRKPRDLLAETLVRFGSFSGRALDLGCGAGIETAELLRRGWHVLAIDDQPEAPAHVRARLSAEEQTRLETQLVSFENVTLPPADLVWAGLSLPFCPPEQFGRLWGKIVAAVRPDGRFAGDFFGPRHVWANNTQMTFHTVAQLRELLQPFDVESFAEEEGAKPTALQGIQHWHAFGVIARKP